jgi:ubiquinone/menaquinone biosynthesis C-methylase UbiE
MRPRRLHQLLAARALAPRVDGLGGGSALVVGHVSLGAAWDVTRVDALDARPDGIFDAVVVLDALEALPWRERPVALHELARVARRHVVVATRLPVLDVLVPLRASGIVRARVVGRPRWAGSYRAIVVAEMAASISASSSSASAS